MIYLDEFLHYNLDKCKGVGTLELLCFLASVYKYDRFCIPSLLILVWVPMTHGGLDNNTNSDRYLAYWYWYKHCIFTILSVHAVYSRIFTQNIKPEIKSWMVEKFSTISIYWGNPQCYSSKDDKVIK